MNIGDIPVFPIQPFVEPINGQIIDGVPGITFRQFLIAMLASNPKMVTNKFYHTTGSEYDPSLTAKVIINQADIIIKKLTDELKRKE